MRSCRNRSRRTVRRGVGGDAGGECESVGRSAGSGEIEDGWRRARRTCSKVFTSLQRKHARVCLTNSRGGSAAVSMAEAIATLLGGSWICGAGREDLRVSDRAPYDFIGRGGTHSAERLFCWRDRRAEVFENFFVGGAPGVGCRTARLPPFAAGDARTSVAHEGSAEGSSRPRARRISLRFLSPDGRSLDHGPQAQG